MEGKTQQTRDEKQCKEYDFAVHATAINRKSSQTKRRIAFLWSTTRAANINLKLSVVWCMGCFVFVFGCVLFALLFVCCFGLLVSILSTSYLSHISSELLLLGYE